MKYFVLPVEAGLKSPTSESYNETTSHPTSLQDKHRLEATGRQFPGPWAPVAGFMTDIQVNDTICA